MEQAHCALNFDEKKLDQDDESTGTVTPREEILPPGKARELDGIP